MTTALTGMGDWQALGFEPPASTHGDAWPGLARPGRAWLGTARKWMGERAHAGVRVPGSHAVLGRAGRVGLWPGRFGRGRPWPGPAGKGKQAGDWQSLRFET